MSINEKMTAIADAIRAKTGGASPLSLDGMAAEIPNVYESGYTAAQSKCQSLYFASRKLGSGTNKIEFDCPFMPDAFALYTWSPTYEGGTNVIRQINIDFRTVYRRGGHHLYQSSTGATTHAYLSTASIYGELIQHVGGKLTVDYSTIPAAIYQALTFGDCLTYSLIAVKYDGLDDLEILTDEINNLKAGGGSVEFSKLRVNSIVSDEEWEEMIADKRADGWTISLV